MVASIIITGFDSWEACSSSGGWLQVQLVSICLRVRNGLFLAAVHSIHSAPPGFWQTGPVYVWFTCMRCQILADLPHLPGTCDFPPAISSQPLFKKSHKLLCGHNCRQRDHPCNSRGGRFNFLLTPMWGWVGFKPAAPGVFLIQKGRFLVVQNSRISIWGQIFEFWRYIFEFWRYIFEFCHHILEF